MNSKYQQKINNSMWKIIEYHTHNCVCVQMFKNCYTKTETEIKINNRQQNMNKHYKNSKNGLILLTEIEMKTEYETKL